MVMIKKFLIPMMLMFMLSGCAALQDQKVELLIAQRSFIAVVDSLSKLNAEGAFSDKEAEIIGELIYKADGILDEWVDAVLDEKPLPQSVHVFNLVMIKLLEYNEKGE